MKSDFVFVSMAVVTLLLSANLTFAEESRITATKVSTDKVKVSVVKDTQIKVHKGNSVNKTILVDINGATSTKLKKLPGIGDAEAAKIIAGRPYGSKAWLVTHNVIDKAAFERIRKLIFAKQPYRNGAKNAAIYTKNSL